MSRWISMFRPSEKIFHSKMCAERCGFECTLFSEKRKKRTRRNVIDDVIIINESLIMIHLLVSINCSEVIFWWNRPKLRTKWLMNWRFSSFFGSVQIQNPISVEICLIAPLYLFISCICPKYVYSLRLFHCRCILEKEFIFEAFINNITIPKKCTIIYQMFNWLTQNVIFSD